MTLTLLNCLMWSVGRGIFPEAFTLLWLHPRSLSQYLIVSPPFSAGQKQGGTERSHATCLRSFLASSGSAQGWSNIYHGQFTMDRCWVHQPANLTCNPWHWINIAKQNLYRYSEHCPLIILLSTCLWIRVQWGRTAEGILGPQWAWWMGVRDLYQWRVGQR